MLRQAKKQGDEGWYAAVARAAEAWEAIDRRRNHKPAVMAPVAGKPLKEETREAEKMDKIPTRTVEEEENHQREQEKLVQQAKDESEARDRRVEEEKRKAEEARRKWDVMEKQRKQKLAGAFAVDNDQDDDGDDRELELLRKKAERRKEASTGSSSIVAISSTPSSLPLRPVAMQSAGVPGET